MEERFQPTEESGRQALRDHLINKARAARARYGPDIDLRAIQTILADRECIRFPTVLVFGHEELQEGEFAWPRPSDSAEGPSGGFTLLVHEHFRDRPEALPLLIAYHLPSINYPGRVTPADAEAYGATLLGLGLEEYYWRLCELADELPREESA
jgi:hypothetical protein